MHKDHQQTKYPTSKVYTLIKAIPSDSGIAKDWKIFYRNLAVEAYYYAAESGSEYAIIWFLNCTCKLFHLIKDDKNFHWMMMLHCGFILYNLVFDLKRRYAALPSSAENLLFAVGEYRNQAEYFVSLYLDSLTNEGEILRTLRCIILTSLYSHMLEQSKVESMIYLTRQTMNLRKVVPSLFIGLRLYEEGMVAASNSRWPEAKEHFYSSVLYLKKHFKEDSFEAIYFYNSLHGIFFIIVMDERLVKIFGNLNFKRKFFRQGKNLVYLLHDSGSL